MDLFEDVSETVRISESAVKEPTTETDVPATLVDNNGNEFQVGGVVRVCAKDLRQFQIPPKGAGRYNDSKEFVPDESKSDKRSNLTLPVGLRGTITKLYQQAELSANYPLQVAFAPGQHVEEGYDPPVAFTMHFMATEVECIVKEEEED